MIRHARNGHLPAGMSVSVNLATLLTIVAAGSFFGGCTNIAQIRTESTGAAIVSAKRIQGTDCYTGSPAANEFKNSIEEYGRYFIGYVEFDDQGWAYTQTQNDQAATLEARLKKELADHPHSDLVTFVFIHGWHHNAHDNDCNVREFREMMRITSETYAQNSPSKRVVGIYVGWRGEAVDAPGLRYSTILDRHYAAESVARGSVRELFAMLRKHEFAEKTSKGPDRMQTVVLGHSFGGLVAFHALSQALLNDIASRKPDAPPGCRPYIGAAAAKSLPIWPDLLVLINPAFEASRFEALHHLMEPVPKCTWPPRMPPRLIVVTADNDEATGFFFPLFGRFGTVFEGYDSRNKSKEEDANLHAIGFVDRYRTHRLCLKEEGGRQQAYAALTPPRSAEWDLDEYAPIWVIGAPPEILNGHDGFLYARQGTQQPQPYLLEWIMRLQSDGPTEAVMRKPGACSGWVY